MEIELISEKYVDDLLVLYNQLLPNEQFVNNSTLSETINKIESYDDYYILVGVINNVAVTTCSLIILPNITHGQRPYAIIENVVTHREHQKKGYAMKILQYAIDVAKGANCHKILLQTRRKELHVHKLYKHLGFSTKETTGYMIDMEEMK